MTEKTTPALQVAGVVKRFGAVTALEDPGSRVTCGGFFISGRERIDSRTMEIEGRDVTEAPISGLGIAPNKEDCRPSIVGGGIVGGRKI